MKRVNCILLVDDNPADNEFHKIIIEEANICDHVHIVVNGQQALDYLLKSGEPNQSEDFPLPAIIYLDINMPGMSGFEFLAEYHKLDENLKSKVMIVMLTTSLNPDDRIRAMTDKEVTEFETKPLTVEMLQEIVEKYF